MYALISQPRTGRATNNWSVALAVGAGLLGASLAVTAWGAIGLIVALSLGSASVAAVVDARSGRIPDHLVAVAALPVTVVVLAEIASGHGGAALVAVSLGSAAAAGPLLLAHLVTPAAIGFGDVKLAFALGSMLGLVDPLLGLVALCVACGAAAAFGLSTRRPTVPLGPGLVLGAIAALAIAGQLGGVPRPWR